MAKKTAVKKQSKASRVKAAMAASSDLLMAMRREKLVQRADEIIAEFGDTGIFVALITNDSVTTNCRGVDHANALLGIEKVKTHILRDHEANATK